MATTCLTVFLIFIQPLDREEYHCVLLSRDACQSSRSLWPVGMESINQDMKMVFIWMINLFYCTVFTGITTALNQLSSFNKGSFSASLQIWAYSI